MERKGKKENQREQKRTKEDRWRVGKHIQDYRQYTENPFELIIYQRVRSKNGEVVKWYRMGNPKQKIKE